MKRIVLGVFFRWVVWGMLFSAPCAASQDAPYAYMTDLQEAGVSIANTIGGVSSLPEPGTMLLLGIGLLGLARINRRILKR